MNTEFNSYIETLTPSKKMVAMEALGVYLKGEGSGTNKCSSAIDIWKMTRYLEMEREEHMVVILVKKNFNVIKTVEVSKGGLDHTIVDNRVILREALLADATQIALVHNHPSGSVRPSAEDMKITEVVKKSCDIFNIRLIDHVIIGEQCYYSFMEEGLL